MKIKPRIIGIQHSWNNFLWKWLDRIQTLRHNREYSRALEVIFELCDFIPKEIYEEMKPKILETKEKFGAAIEAPVDPFENLRIKRKIRENRAQNLMSDLLRLLRDQLEERGYLERKERPIEIGFEKALSGENES